MRKSVTPGDTLAAGPVSKTLDRLECCLTTLTDEEYFAGTMVLVSSFLRHNPWFRGDIIVQHDGLRAETKRRLERYPRVTFRTVSPELKARVDELCAVVPRAARKRRFFHKLDAFSLPGYDKVLTLDSDMVCAGSVADLFAMEGALVCCPDQAYFTGRSRDARSYAPVPRVEHEQPSTIAITFNTGMMLLSPRDLGTSAFADVLSELSPETMSTVTTGHADSVVLNRHFRGRWTPAPARYNYLISPASARYTQREGTLDDAALVHFLGRPKPWQPDRAASSAEHLAAFEIWDRAAARA
jgi:lipopolysaccharide biosynthesis glycosyltransferase